MISLTNYDRILNLLLEEGKPLQRRDIYQHTKIEDSTLGVILHKMCEKQLLGMVKYPGTPAFYGHPVWIHRGQFIQEFDPIFKQWKKDQKNNGIKD